MTITYFFLLYPICRNKKIKLDFKKLRLDFTELKLRFNFLKLRFIFKGFCFNFFETLLENFINLTGNKKKAA